MVAAQENPQVASDRASKRPSTRISGSPFQPASTGDHPVPRPDRQHFVLATHNAQITAVDRGEVTVAIPQGHDDRCPAAEILIEAHACGIGDLDRNAAPLYIGLSEGSREWHGAGEKFARASRVPGIRCGSS